MTAAMEIWGWKYPSPPLKKRRLVHETGQAQMFTGLWVPGAVLRTGVHPLLPAQHFTKDVDNLFSLVPAFSPL